MAKPAGGRLVYGLHAARSAIARRPGAIEAATLLDGELSPALQDIERALGQHGVAIRRVQRAELDRLCDGGRHQGVALDVCGGLEFRLADLETLVLERGPALRLLVLDQVEDPRNLGACLRTADAAGIDAVVIPKNRAADLTPAAIKAAAGAAESVPVHRATNLARLLRWLREAGVTIVGTDDSAGESLYAGRLAAPIALVLGGEGRGLRRLTREYCDRLVAIPMRGTVGSLNVSVAAGIVMYELVRQNDGGDAV